MQGRRADMRRDDFVPYFVEKALRFQSYAEYWHTHVSISTTSWNVRYLQFNVSFSHDTF